MKLVKSSVCGDVSFNYTPILNGVFCLLIFFVLTAQFMTLEVEDVVLPPSLTAEPKDYTQFRNVVINIIRPENPAIVVMGHEHTYRTLTEHLKSLNESAKADNVKMNVILRADRKVPYEDVARAMLAAGNAQIEGWWIQADISRVEKATLKGSP
jgi:biopolymer transport protein ExbD